MRSVYLNRYRPRHKTLIMYEPMRRPMSLLVIKQQPAVCDRPSRVTSRYQSTGVCLCLRQVFNCFRFYERCASFEQTLVSTATHKHTNT